MEKIQPVIQIEHLSKHSSTNNGFFSKGKKTVKAVNDFTLNLEKGKILGRRIRFRKNYFGARDTELNLSNRGNGAN